MAGSQPGAARGAHRGDDGSDLDPAGDTITRRFVAAARGAASTVAAVQGGRTLTYAELDRRSNQLARLLRRRGVGPGGIIGLHSGRSCNALIALLAVVKSRAVYVPLDCTVPVAYLDSMVHDCGMAMVLSASPPAQGFAAPTVGLEEALTLAATESEAALDDDATPEDIAYVMYTSGSTGRPKGVRVPHRAVVRVVTGQNYAHFGPDEVFLHSAPLAFDASTFEIWGTLLHGARGVLIEEDRPSLQMIADTIRQHGVTTAWFTAGLFHALIDHQIEALHGLRHLLAGGDVLSPNHVKRALAALPDCQIVNGYGPTENTTFTCCYRIPRDGWNNGPVPIGHPIHGTYVRILDSDMKPVPDGEIGILYAGGLGVACGYVGETQRTKEQFIADPYRDGAMLYCTGDLVRRRPDGNLDFIGRQDRQVKIDGKRVELGEIEETLRRSDHVGDAVVLMARSAVGVPLLTAYITPASAGQPHTSVVAAIRRHVDQVLPTYMRPSQIHVLDAFPLTANGKVDRARLSSLESKAPSPTSLAANETQRVLGEILGNTLGVAEVGLDTNFFDLGATSLKLVEAHASISRIWPGVAVLALFQHPNLRELARAIDGGRPVIVDTAQRRARQQAEALKRLRAARQRR